MTRQSITKHSIELFCSDIFNLQNQKGGYKKYTLQNIKKTSLYPVIMHRLWYSNIHCFKLVSIASAVAICILFQITMICFRFYLSIDISCFIDTRTTSLLESTFRPARKWLMSSISSNIFWRRGAETFGILIIGNPCDICRSICHKIH